MRSPAFRQRLNLNSAPHQIKIFLLVGVQSNYVGDCNVAGVSAEQFDFISGSYLALLHNRQIKSAATAGQKSFEDVVAVEFCRQFVTRHSRLRDDNFNRPDAEAVADIDLIFESLADFAKAL